MDILRYKRQGRWKRKILLAFAALISVAALIYGFSFKVNEPKKIDRASLLVGKVRRGRLQVNVDGYGVLRSERQTLITALSNATVKEVKLRPGAQVKKDTVILQLSGPQLLQDFEAASNEVAQAEATLRRASLTNRRELLAEKMAMAEVTVNLEILELRRKAEESLVESGVVSKISYQTTQLQVQQFQNQKQLLEQRIGQLHEITKESQIIQQEQVNRARSHHEVIKGLVDGLTVRAGMDGVLQRLPVELGQSVVPGEELALVGSDEDLLALIQISQSKIGQLKVGQPAEIDTRSEKISGVVSRIAPEVHDGAVEVEIRFVGGIPSSARPELTVDARIFTATFENTLYIERPINAQALNGGVLFRLEENGSYAQRQRISFGLDSGRFIQILSGANEQDSFILSDLSKYREFDTIRIVN